MKIKVWDDYQCNQTRIFVSVESQYGLKFAYNPISGKKKQLNEGESIEEDYIIKIPIDMKQELIDSLTEEFSRTGNTPKHEARIEGILESTKYHLEDMRKLVFGNERH